MTTFSFEKLKNYFKLRGVEIKNYYILDGKVRILECECRGSVSLLVSFFIYIDDKYIIKRQDGNTITEDDGDDTSVSEYLKFLGKTSDCGIVMKNETQIFFVDSLGLGMKTFFEGEPEEDSLDELSNESDLSDSPDSETNEHISQIEKEIKNLRESKSIIKKKDYSKKTNENVDTNNDDQNLKDNTTTENTSGSDQNLKGDDQEFSDSEELVFEDSEGEEYDDIKEEINEEWDSHDNEDISHDDYSDNHDDYSDDEIGDYNDTSDSTKIGDIFVCLMLKDFYRLTNKTVGCSKIEIFATECYQEIEKNKILFSKEKVKEIKGLVETVIQNLSNKISDYETKKIKIEKDIPKYHILLEECNQIKSQSQSQYDEDINVVYENIMSKIKESKNQILQIENEINDTIQNHFVLLKSL